MPTYPTISALPAVQAAYERMRAEGTSHNLAEMFALQQAPAVDTNDTFLAGLYSEQAKEFNAHPEIAAKLAEDLRAQGGSTAGKVYLGGLAEFPGDPKAWVSGKDDVNRVARERNYGIKSGATGATKRKRDGRPPMPGEESKLARGRK